MLDAQNAPAAPPAAIRREDYRPPDWLVPEIALEFELDAERTLVRARLEVERNGAHQAPLRLEPPKARPCSASLSTARRSITGSRRTVLRIPHRGRIAHVVETEVPRSRRAPTPQLMGLYESGGMLCTQCEAEGFRRITPFPDRPDVLRRYRVRMTADKARYPVLLSNGDPVGVGRARRTAGTGRNGTIPSPSPAICSRWSPATSPPIATASPPARAARSISASGCATAICRGPSMPWHRSRRR